MTRGLLKLNVLSELKINTLTGKDLMDIFEQKYGSRPSPGSIYPLLDELNRDGLVELTINGRDKFYSITKKGLKANDFCLREKEKFLKNYISVMSRINPDKKKFFMSVFDSLSKQNFDTVIIEEFVNLKTNSLQIMSDKQFLQKRAYFLKILKQANLKLKKLLNSDNTNLENTK